MRIVMVGKSMLAASVLMLSACGDSGGGENSLVYDGEALQINEVSCLTTLKQMVIRFDGGTLRLSPHNSDAGFRAVLRFEDRSRGNLTNRAQDGSNTGGIDLDIQSGASGRVQMMREAWVMDPERHPDAEAIALEVQLRCPDDT